MDRRRNMTKRLMCGKKTTGWVEFYQPDGILWKWRLWNKGQNVVIAEAPGEGNFSRSTAAETFGWVQTLLGECPRIVGEPING